jgi:glycosyltransferase involved in cell wall biosynthesis
MRRPDLTIIVSTFDRADWLAVSLQSILTSAAFAEITGIRTRILVVDDGSPTDAAGRVAERLGVDYIRRPVNDGLKCPSAARVLGLEQVDSPYVAFFDDDDVMLPRWIPLHFAALEAGHDVCSSACWRTDADLVPTRRFVPLPATMGDLLAGRVSVNDGSLLRSEVAQEITWDPGLENVMVYAAWMELMYRGRSFHRLEEPTFLYRRHRGNISDQVGEGDRLRRLELQRRYRELVLARDGGLPRPTSRLHRAIWRVRSAIDR